MSYEHCVGASLNMNLLKPFYIVNTCEIIVLKHRYCLIIHINIILQTYAQFPQVVSSLPKYEKIFAL
jgi:hypothetical protein